MTGSLAIGNQMNAAIVGQMTEILRKACPDIPERILNVLPEEVSAVFSENLGNFKDVVVPVYHERFTEGEIKEMIRFHSTPFGELPPR